MSTNGDSVGPWSQQSPEVTICGRLHRVFNSPNTDSGVGYAMLCVIVNDEAADTFVYLGAMMKGILRIYLF